MCLKSIGFFSKLSLLLFSFIVVIISEPMIHVDQPEFDVGKIKEGTKEKIKHVFKIKNTGDQVLKIEKVRPG